MHTMAKTSLAGAFTLMAMAGGCEYIQFSRYPVERGEKYLLNTGYTTVTGGRRDYFNGCGKGSFARTYDAVRKADHQHESVTVCFNPFWGAFRPAFWEY